MDTLQIPTADGVELHVDRHPAHGEPWATAVLLHAMMVDRRSMDRPAGAGLASTLAGHGLEVWNADFRGHGLSGSHGPWTYDDLVLSDIPALVDAAKAATSRPVWVVGLSLGAHTTLASIAAGRAHPDGLVLLSGNVWRPAYEPSPMRRVRKHLAMVGMRAVTRAAGRFPSRALRTGPADEAAPYVADLTGFWYRDRWTSREGVDWHAALPTVDVPVLSVVGRADTLLAHHAGARNFVDRVPGAVFAHVGRGDCGLDFDPDHMGLGADPRCKPLWHWLAQWMRSRSVR